MDTFIAHPRDSAHTVVLFFMDAPGIREELRGMARRLAGHGYYVMLPNLYYRKGVTELGPPPLDATSDAFLNMVELMRSVTIADVMSDAKCLFAYADKDTAAKPEIAAALGYCMSGQFAVNAATCFPDRIRAAASFYGTRMMTETADSPHLAMLDAQAEIYLSFAEIDQWAPLSLVSELKARALGTNGRVRIEVYPGVEHGFAFPERPQFDEKAAERHWEKIIDLFDRRLHSA